MQQHSRCQKVVSMQLSLLADNRDALSLSFEERESALLCSSHSLCLPAHLQQQQQQDSRAQAPEMSAEVGNYKLL